MSFFVSRTVTPLLCLYLRARGTRARPTTGVPGAISRALRALDDAYARSAGLGAAPPRLTVIVASWRSSACSLFSEALHRDGVLPGQRRVRSSPQLQGADRDARRADRADRRSASRRRSTRRWRQRERASRYTTMIADIGLPAGPHRDLLPEHRAALGQRPRQPGAAVAARAIRRAGGRGGAQRRCATRCPGRRSTSSSAAS